MDRTTPDMSKTHQVDTLRALHLHSALDRVKRNANVRCGYGTTSRDLHSPFLRQSRYGSSPYERHFTAPPLIQHCATTRLLLRSSTIIVTPTRPQRTIRSHDIVLVCLSESTSFDTLLTVICSIDTDQFPASSVREARHVPTKKLRPASSFSIRRLPRHAVVEWACASCIIIQHYSDQRERELTMWVSMDVPRAGCAMCARRHLDPARVRPDWVTFAPTYNVGIERLPASAVSSCWRSHKAPPCEHDCEYSALVSE